MATIIDHLSQGEILSQMAEELAEAAQAALKLRRALDDSNPDSQDYPRMLGVAGRRNRRCHELH